jgi:hypothetical protein
MSFPIKWYNFQPNPFGLEREGLLFWKFEIAYFFACQYQAVYLTAAKKHFTL